MWYGVQSAAVDGDGVLLAGAAERPGGEPLGLPGGCAGQATPLRHELLPHLPRTRGHHHHSTR